MTDRHALPTPLPPHDLLERYVLGLLDEPEREAIEARAFAEPDVAAAVDAAETDLVDAWVGGTLAGEPRQAFARALVRRERLRARVDVAVAMVGAGARAATAPARPTPPIRLAWLVGLASAAAILVSVAVWLARSPADTDATGVPPTAEARAELPAAPRAATRPDAPATSPPSPSPPSSAPAPARVVFAVRLPSATTRSAAVTPVEVPRDATHVQLSIPVAEGDDFARYALVVTDRTGRVVASVERQALVPGRMVSLILPRSTLRDGLHEVTLTGWTADNAQEPLALVQIDVAPARRP